MCVALVCLKLHFSCPRVPLALPEYSKYRLSSRSTSLAAQDFPPERKQDADTPLGSQAPPSPDGGQSSSGRGAAVPDAAEEEQWEFKPPLDRQFSRSRAPSLEFSTPNTDDEGPGTPTASGTPAGGSVVGGNSGSPTRLLSAAQSQKQREGSGTGEGAAERQGEQEPEPEVELRPLVPPGTSDESPPRQPRPSAAAGPSALSLCMEPLDRKGASVGRRGAAGAAHGFGGLWGPQLCWGGSMGRGLSPELSCLSCVSTMVQNISRLHSLGQAGYGDGLSHGRGAAWAAALQGEPPGAVMPLPYVSFVHRAIVTLTFDV